MAIAIVASWEVTICYFDKDGLSHFKEQTHCHSTWWEMTADGPFYLQIPGLANWHLIGFYNWQSSAGFKALCINIRESVESVEETDLF